MTFSTRGPAPDVIQQLCNFSLRPIISQFAGFPNCNRSNPHEWQAGQQGGPSPSFSSAVWVSKRLLKAFREPLGDVTVDMSVFFVFYSEALSSFSVSDVYTAGITRVSHGFDRQLSAPLSKEQHHVSLQKAIMTAAVAPRSHTFFTEVCCIAWPLTRFFCSDQMQLDL